MIIVLIGPMGCGKTTVGKLLARKLNYDFADADDFHSLENIAKMRAGIPLDDADRQSWLDTLKQLIRTSVREGKHLVLACSALKQRYRDILGINQKDVLSVYLKGSLPLLEKRIGSRAHPYMNKHLLASQMDTLEEPADGLVIDISDSPSVITDKIVEHINHLKWKK